MWAWCLSNVESEGLSGTEYGQCEIRKCLILFGKLLNEQAYEIMQ